MGLQDIQIRIIMGVQGSGAVTSAGAALGGLRGQYQAFDPVQKQMTWRNMMQAKSWGSVIGAIGELEKKYDGIYRAAYRVSYAGQQLQSIGMAGLGVLKQSADAWGEYEFMLNRAAGAMEVFDKTSVVYQHLKTGIMDVTRELRLFPAADVAKAVYFWQSTTGQQIRTLKDLQIVLDGVKTSMQVAAMTQTDYESVIKGAYSIMRQYGMALTDIPSILKVLFLETQRTSLEFGDLIQSFKFVGPIAHALGANFTDVAKWLGMIGDLGQRGSMSGRGLGMMFTQIVRPTAKAIGAFNDLYQKVYGVSNAYNKVIFPKGKFIGFEKYVTILAKATAGLTQQQRLQYVTSIVGTQNSARIIVPLIEAQIDALKRQSNIFNESKYSAAGAAKVFDQAWGILADSWKGVVGLMQETVEPIILLVGERIAKALTPFIKQAADALNVLRLWLQQNPAIVDMAVNVLAVASAFAAALGSLLIFVGGAMALYAALRQVGMAVVVLVAPFVLLAGIIALVAKGIQENWGGIADALNHAFLTISMVVSSIARDLGGFQADNKGVIDWINGPVKDAFRVAADAIHWFATKLAELNQTKEGHQALVDITKAVIALASVSIGIRTAGLAFNILFGGLIGLKLFSPIITAFIGAITGISTVLKVAKFAFASFSTGVTLALSLIVAHPVIAAIVAIAALLFVAWQTNFLGIQDVVKGVIDWLSTNLMPFITNLVGVVGGLLGGILAPITDNWPKVVAFVQGVVDKLAGAWGPVIANVAKTIAGVWNNIVNTVGNAIDQVAKALGPLMDALGRLATAIQQFVGPAWDLLVKVVGGSVGAIIKFATDLLAGIAPIVGGIVDLLVRVLGPIIEGIVNIVANAVTTIIGVVTGFVNIITGIINIFTALLTGNWSLFWQGLQNIAGGILDILKSIIGGAIGFIGTIFDTGLKFIASIFEFIFGAAPGSLLSTVGAFLVALPGNIAAFIAGVIQQFIDFGAGLINTIVTFLADIANNWNVYLGYAIGFVIGFIVKTLADIGTFIANAVSMFFTFLSNLPGTFATWLGNVWTTLSNWFIKTINDAGAWTGQMIAKIIQWFINLPGNIATWLGEVWNKMSSWFGTTATSAGAAAGNMIADIVQWFAKFPGQAMDAISGFALQLWQWLHALPGQIWTAILNIGEQIIKGIWQGIQDMVGWFTNKVTGFFGGLIDGIKDQLGIKSPSKVTAEVGAYMIQGLAQGILSTSDAYAAMQRVTTGLAGIAAAGASDIGSSLTTAISGASSYSISSDTTRTIRLEVSVTSPDGSVSQLDASQIAGLLDNGDLVRALEHMASVD